jgi:hypothetical protein
LREFWAARAGVAARIPGVHRITTILSTMLITAGLVVLADAGITLLWQEPVSAAYGSLEQGQARDELSDLESQFPATGDLAALRGVVGDTACSPTCSRRRSARGTPSGGSRSTASG